MLVHTMPRELKYCLQKIFGGMTEDNGVVVAGRSCMHKTFSDRFVWAVLVVASLGLGELAAVGSGQKPTAPVVPAARSASGRRVRSM